jgi:hypothetical protein
MKVSKTQTVLIAIAVVTLIVCLKISSTMAWPITATITWEPILMAFASAGFLTSVPGIWSRHDSKSLFRLAGTIWLVMAGVFVIALACTAALSGSFEQWSSLCLLLVLCPYPPLMSENFLKRLFRVNEGA